MPKRVALVALMAAMILTTWLGAAPATPLRLAAVESLEKALQGKHQVSVAAGDEVFLALAAEEAQGFRQDLTVWDHKKKVKVLEGGRFLEFARLDAPPATYWIISAFTGGAHCCGELYCFVRPAAGRPLRFLGKTEGYNGGPMPLRGSLIFEQGETYLRAFLNRFDYFHASHADSRLVNVPPVFYRLALNSFKMDNRPFAQVYREEAARVQGKIDQELASRRVKPRAIFQTGFGSGYENLTFSDPLGQLLVKRTIFYLYAGEDRKAWETLERDVKQNYQSGRWLPELKREIAEKIRQAPK